jgi:sulfur carrier protein
MIKSIMNIIINNEPVTVAPDTNLAQLLEQLTLSNTRIAVERNMELVPRSLHASTTLHEGDRIEIVKAVSGG